MNWRVMPRTVSTARTGDKHVAVGCSHQPANGQPLRRMASVAAVAGARAMNELTQHPRPLPARDDRGPAAERYLESRPVVGRNRRNAVEVDDVRTMDAHELGGIQPRLERRLRDLLTAYLVLASGMGASEASHRSWVLVVTAQAVVTRWVLDDPGLDRDTVMHELTRLSGAYLEVR